MEKSDIPNKQIADTESNKESLPKGQEGILIIEGEKGDSKEVEYCLGSIDDAVKAFQAGAKKVTWRPVKSSIDAVIRETIL